MLQVSDSALTLLKEALEVERSDDSEVFRLDVRDEQFVLGLDQAQGDDVQFEQEGTPVLAASRDVAGGVLAETTIDLEATDDGPRLVLLTPDED